MNRLSVSWRVSMAGVVALLLLVQGCGTTRREARQEVQRGVYVPDAGSLYVSTRSKVSRTPDGARIAIIGEGVEQSWKTVRRALARLGIAYEVQDGHSPRLLTGWVIWSYDPDQDRGRSKRPGFGVSGTDERHRFRFSLDPAGTGILVSDAARQREVDIAPDSEYSWLEWRDVAPSPAAAFAFARRLQSDIEAVLSLAPTESALPATGGEPAAPQQPIPTAVEPAGRVAHPESPVTASAPAKAPVGAAVAAPATAVSPGAPVPESGPAPQAATVQPAPVAVAGNTLLLDAPPARAWEALLRALQDAKVELQTIDRSQLLVTTDWVDARYDRKNHQLVFRSNEPSRWAFDLRGHGAQRHRFQLLLIPAGQGRSLLRAYHVGFQEEVDLTPDSSQTLLQWEDRRTDPAIAAAFLRYLRIVPR